MGKPRDETVSFYSGGLNLVATLHLPASSKPAVLIHGPGWLELRCSALSEPYHQGFVEAGFAVLNFDGRGFGDSEGERGWLRPFDQVEDILAAIAYVRTRADLGPIGLYGVGATGGGNAIYAAAADEAVKAVVAQTVVTDGPEWLRHMRREHEWVEFLDRVDRNRLRRVIDNSDEMIEPREEIMIATPERRASGARKGDDVKVGGDFHLSMAEELLRYRPIDVVGRITPRALLMTCVERDDVTPDAHAMAMYEAAGSPKRLIRQLGVRHYESYRKNQDLLLGEFVAWYRKSLTSGARAEIHSSDRRVEIREA
jgi:dipeptidyl aminopeptidase/acylaminoacyl peptidase